MKAAGALLIGEHDFRLFAKVSNVSIKKCDNDDDDDMIMILGFYCNIIYFLKKLVFLCLFAKISNGLIKKCSVW